MVYCVGDDCYGGRGYSEKDNIRERESESHTYAIQWRRTCLAGIVKGFQQLVYVVYIIQKALLLCCRHEQRMLTRVHCFKVMTSCCPTPALLLSFSHSNLEVLFSVRMWVTSDVQRRIEHAIVVYLLLGQLGYSLAFLCRHHGSGKGVASDPPPPHLGTAYCCYPNYTLTHRTNGHECTKAHNVLTSILEERSVLAAIVSCQSHQGFHTLSYTYVHIQ